MGTVTITASGFSALGASPPANWPPLTQVAFPVGGNPNGTKTYTINDADWLMLLTWVARSQFQATAGPPGQPAVAATPTAPQMLLAWLNIWINGTKQAVQQDNAVPAAVPPPIAVT